MSSAAQRPAQAPARKCHLRNGHRPVFALGISRYFQNNPGRWAGPGMLAPALCHQEGELCAGLGPGLPAWGSPATCLQGPLGGLTAPGKEEPQSPSFSRGVLEPPGLVERTAQAHCAVGPEAGLEAGLLSHCCCHTLEPLPLLKTPSLPAHGALTGTWGRGSRILCLWTDTEARKEDTIEGKALSCPAPCVLRPAPCTLHPAPCVLCPASCALCPVGC